MHLVSLFDSTASQPLLQAGRAQQHMARSWYVRYTGHMSQQPKHKVMQLNFYDGLLTCELLDLFLQALLGGSNEVCPFLLLKVRRGPFLLSDTLLQINNAKNNGSLKKPLKVRVQH